MPLQRTPATSGVAALTARRSRVDSREPEHSRTPPRSPRPTHPRIRRRLSLRTLRARLPIDRAVCAGRVAVNALGGRCSRRHEDVPPLRRRLTLWGALFGFSRLGGRDPDIRANPESVLIYGRA